MNIAICGGKRPRCKNPFDEKKMTNNCSLKYFIAFDQLDLVTYEEVVQEQYFKRKTLVLLGKLCQMTKL